QGENFIVHFTTADNDFQNINGQLYSLQSNYGYAQSILNWAEYSLNIYLENEWEDIPPDCDESILDLNSPHHCMNFGGNALYDIYISNDGPGMVVPENAYPVLPYTGGRTSYMKISTLSNNYQSLPSWSHHVVAHEVHHAIQMRYGTGTSGTSGNYTHNLWFFEQTATYMENVIFPNSNHLYTMLANCDVVTPLTHANLGIDYPAEIYPYRSSLWQKYLVESTQDSSIIRYMWEDYGLQFASGENVSLFPIYESSINIATENQFTMGEAFNEYALWRYFTGERSIQNSFFEESAGYCAASIDNIGQEYSLLSNTGGAYFISFPNDETPLIISSDYSDYIDCRHLSINSDNELILSDLIFYNNNIAINSDPDFSEVLICNTNYRGINSNEISFSVNIDNINLLGDLNYDGEINILDVILAVDMILNEEFNSLVDLNQDQNLNISDIILLINIILN
ncbi:hypothetical protein OAQ87_00790, partial [Candidatus Marinimicrobia bacterium]|nr:hypothetical protein [Candidatus Neomarinimicrobiota bacterium]